MQYYCTSIVQYTIYIAADSLTGCATGATTTLPCSSEFSLQKIWFHLKILLHESIILILPPPELDTSGGFLDRLCKGRNNNLALLV